MKIKAREAVLHNFTKGSGLGSNYHARSKALGGKTLEQLSAMSLSFSAGFDMSPSFSAGFDLQNVQGPAPKASDGSTGACWFTRWLVSWWGACELGSWEVGVEPGWMGLGGRSDGCFSE